MGFLNPKLTGSKPKGIKVETFEIHYLIRTPKVEKFSLQPISKALCLKGLGFRVSMGFYWVSIGFLRVSIGFLRVSMVFYGFLWVSMGFSGFLRVSTCFLNPKALRPKGAFGPSPPPGG